MCPKSFFLIPLVYLIFGAEPFRLSALLFKRGAIFFETVDYFLKATVFSADITLSPFYNGLVKSELARNCKAFDLPGVPIMSL